MLTKIIHDTLVPEENDMDTSNEDLIIKKGFTCEDMAEGYQLGFNQSRKLTINNIPLFKEKIIEDLEKEKLLEVAVSPERLREKIMYNKAIDRIINLLKN